MQHIQITLACISCGSEHGEELENGNENWSWRMLPKLPGCGEQLKVGPFCCEQCAKNFRFPEEDEPTFKLEEWEKLRFMKWNYAPEVELRKTEITEETRVTP